MFAPISTPMDCLTVMRPAFAKLTTITEVTEESWMSTVVMKPVKTLRKRFAVITFSTSRMRAPATFCRPSLMAFMP